MSTPQTQAGVAVRVIAARVLDAVLNRGRSLKAEFANALPQIDDVRDRALVEAICFAVLRQRARYEAAMKRWLQRPLGPGDGDLKAVMMVGFAQLDALGLPAHAALSSTVEAVRVLGRPHQAGMVNAVLRRAQREGLPSADASATWPGWLADQVRQDWPLQSADIFEASAHAAPLWLRVNRRRTNREAYSQRLQEIGIRHTNDKQLSDAIRIDEPLAVSALPGFAEGEVSVQDASAQAVADALAPAAGGRVLDACAAPGGKTAHLLERDNRLQVLALDVDGRRLKRVAETLERVGVEAQLQAADASDVASWWDGQGFDAVLLDAPCSATGVVRRQPDVLLHRRPADVESLIALQARLLDALWATVKPGGVLLYSTCSILKFENAQQIDAFLARTADAKAEPLDASFGLASGVGRQRFPGDAGRDGFFYALLRKAS